MCERVQGLRSAATRSTSLSRVRCTFCTLRIFQCDSLCAEPSAGRPHRLISKCECIHICLYYHQNPRCLKNADMHPHKIGPFHTRDRRPALRAIIFRVNSIFIVNF